ncbi:HTH-type transcriptional repressor YcgE [Cedecea lapagei]|uniref:HTH-type transcriptional repressor YcgE n=1 Tax=Cedecea lapagei TaxID=158823 RepID=A0A3S4MDQ0_9ENTR|nr:MerR family transcriptional regulator [Cedecea lapagei]VEB96963.1 HTH-type transcriptional repressor YcgE [Cedecea lapagei]
MARFNIDVLASQCGVTPANIRSWQRYGLIKPLVDENGHRFFNFTHFSRVMAIVGLLEKGAALPDMLARLNGDKTSPPSGWVEVQEALLALCEAMQPAKLRGLIWRCGRELPPAIFIDEIIRPLRLWLNAGVQQEMVMSRALLDTALTEYATFVLASGRKRPGGRLFILALSLRDPVELWLEGIRFASDGFCVEVLDREIPCPDLSGIAADHIMIWTDKPLDQEQQALYQRWLKSGLPVFLAGSEGAKAQRSQVAPREPLPADRVLLSASLSQQEV